MYDYNSRFYDPQAGQFIQPDRLIPELYNPIALNRYAYVYNSPVNYTDSTGAFIDTLVDLYDLGSNVQSCLGDSDALACYMAPVSLAAVVIPGATGTGAAGRAARTANTADNFTPSCAFNSFTAGTMVHTEAGLVPIESIKVGDKVFAQDPETGQQGHFEVVALHSHPVDEVLRVTVDDDQDQFAAEVMEITPGHPVYVEGKGWVKAEALALGDRLRRADGGWARILALERVVLDAPQMVYNLTVQGMHTYFVLEVGVLVHNCTNIPLSNFPSGDLEFFHGTTAPKQAFDNGIDISKGGGQLGPGFYVTPNLDVAILHTQYKSLETGGNINILKFTIPGNDLNKLNIITLERESSAFKALTKAANSGTPIPKEFQYLIDDYDAILAPLRTPLGTDVWQLKFNPRAGEFLNRYTPKFETLY